MIIGDINFKHLQEQFSKFFQSNKTSNKSDNPIIITRQVPNRTDIIDGGRVADKLLDEILDVGSGSASYILKHDVTPQNSGAVIQRFNNYTKNSGKRITRFLNGEMKLTRQECAIPALRYLECPFNEEIKNSEQYKQLQTTITKYLDFGGSENADKVDDALEKLINYCIKYSKFEEEMDNCGNIIQMKHYNAYGLDYKEESEYDSRNNKTKCTLYKPSDEIIYEEHYKYDNKDRMTQKSRHIFDGDNKYEYNWFYKEGKLVKLTRVNPDGSEQEVNRVADVREN